MAKGDGRPRRVDWLGEAVKDRERVKADEPAVWDRARAYLRLVEKGEYEGEPLTDAANTGDLADCRKIYVGDGSPGPPSHRVVYRNVGPDTSVTPTIEVVEIVAIAEREDSHVYMQSARRLGRLPVETEPQAKRVHDQQVEKRAAKRSARKPKKT